MRIGRKLLAAFVAVDALLLLLGGAAFWSVSTLTAAADQEAAIARRLDQMGTFRLYVRSMQEVASDYLVVGNQVSSERHRAEFAALQEETTALLTNLRGQATAAWEQAAWDEMAGHLQHLGRAANQAFALDYPGGNPQSLAIMSELDRAVEETLKQFNAVYTVARSRATHVQTSVHQLEGQVRLAVTALTGVAVLFSLGIATWLGRSISRRVRQVAAAAQRLAGGDLTLAELPDRSRDELGELARSFNQMTANLRELITGASGATAAVLTAAAELSAASEQSAQGVQETSQSLGHVAAGAGDQARSADEVRQTMRQMREAIGQIAEGSQKTADEVNRASQLLGEMVTNIEGVAGAAQQVAAGAGQAAATAREGAEVVEQTVAGMGRIHEVVKASAAEIRRLEELSGQIGTISQVISGIAEKTNLLALNAAIEAARAGEHGRGFAVVAGQVRSLAEQSAASAREIGDLIASVQGRTAAAAQAMAVGTTEVEAGSRLAADAGRQLAAIRSVVDRAAQDVQRIAAAAQEIHAGTQQVVQAFDAVAAVTEENTAATEEMAAAVDQASHAVERVAAVSTQNAGAAQQVAAAVDQIQGSAAGVAVSARNLQQVARELEGQLNRFRR